MSTTKNTGGVKSTYWGGKGRQLGDNKEADARPEVKRARADMFARLQALFDRQLAIPPGAGGVPDLPKLRKPGERLWHESPILHSSGYEC